MIKQIYRASRTKQGERVVSRMYRGRYRLNPQDKLKDFALHTNDKQVAEKRLTNIIQEEQQEVAGFCVPKRVREAVKRNLVEFVQKFITDRRALGRDEKYVNELRKKLLVLVEECGWRTAGDMNAESFCGWRSKQHKAPKTLNEYLIAARAFSRWLEPQIGVNPLRFIEKGQANGESPRVRRAFTEDELQRLIIAGGSRGVVYLIAARTGIRRGELEQVEWRDIHLDTPQPFLLVRASVSKNHRQAMQPLSPDGAAALLDLGAKGREPYERVFVARIPRMVQFKKDLVAAEIPYVDGRGEYADFHSLRKTFGTMLTLAGVGLRTVMELMRHSDMRLTTKTYTDANMLPISDAMVSLARFAAAKPDSQDLVSESPAVSAVVPFQMSKLSLLTTGEQTFSPSESASVRVRPEVEENARCRVRTCDFLRVKQALYH